MLSREHGVLNYLKSLNLKSSSERDIFCSILLQICDEESIDDEDFTKWLYKRIGKKPYQVKVIESRNKKETRGSKTSKPLELRQAVHDAWHEFSEVTADHRGT